MKTEAQLIREIGSARTLSAQMTLVEELDGLRLAASRQTQRDRDIDWSAAVVRDTLTPVSVHEFHTASTDWLGEIETEPANSHQAALAEAALWYQRLIPEVKADREEFREQARGAARRTAGRFGTKAREAERAFLDYVAFLRAREGASGLDQIEQTTAPDGVTEKPGELPPDVFDTFEEPVEQMNMGVDEAQSSENAPLLQEIMGEGGGSGQPEVPNEHDTAPEPESAADGFVGYEGGEAQEPEDQPGVALSHLYDLDQFKAAEDVSRRVASQRKQVAASPLGTRRQVVARVQVPIRKRSASGLDQIEQTVNVDDQPAPTPMPEETMFPIVSLPEPTSTFENTEQGPTDAMQAAEAEGQGEGTAEKPDEHDEENKTARRLRITQATQQTSDYRKAYRYAAKWQPGQPLVRMGSAQFEAGLLAGLVTNRRHGGAFVSQSQAQGRAYPELVRRVALHQSYFQRLAETSTDLDTFDPSTSPSADGNTPVNGKGTEPEMAGGQNPAAPGGPAPYNGTEPFGSPVTDNPEWLDPQDSTTTQEPMEGPTPNITDAPQISPQALAFRKKVQAGVLNQNKARSRR